MSFYGLYEKEAASDTATFSRPAELTSRNRTSPSGASSQNSQPSARTISARSNSFGLYESSVSYAADSTNILDQWILSRLNQLNSEVTQAMEKVSSSTKQFQTIRRLYRRPFHMVLASITRQERGCSTKMTKLQRSIQPASSSSNFQNSLHRSGAPFDCRRDLCKTG